MSEKRFKIAKGVPTDLYADILNNGEEMYLGEIVTLLNYFYEMKENFKKENKQLKKENELLKTEVEHLKSHYEHQCRKLAKENDKLKETCNKFEEAIEKRGYEDINDFW